MSKPRRRPLPVDDARWLPMQEAHRQLTLRTGHPGLAASDLDKALENNLLGCMRRSINFGERELVLLEHWGFPSSGGLYMLSADKEGRLEVLDNEFKPIRNSVFYVWGPDFERFKGTESPIDDDAALARNKPGKSPTHARTGKAPIRAIPKGWQILIATMRVVFPEARLNHAGRRNAIAGTRRTPTRKYWAPYPNGTLSRKRSITSTNQRPPMRLCKYRKIAGDYRDQEIRANSGQSTPSNAMMRYRIIARDLA